MRYSLLILALGPIACSSPGVDDEPLGVASSKLVTPFVVEAETATGAGTIEADAAASGGQVLALTVVGSTATTSFSLPPAYSLSGTVRVRGEACSPAQSIRVIVDGTAGVTAQIDGTAWTDIPISLYVGEGPHTLAFHYRQGARGCTLRVDRMTFMVEEPPPPPDPPVPPTTLDVEAETATGPGVVEADPTASGGQLRAFTTPYQTATASFTTTGTMTSGTVRVRGTSCGLWSPPWVKVLVDGEDVLTTTVPQTSWTDLALDVLPLPPGPHTVGFQYRYGDAGCALRFDKATFVTSP